MRVRRFCRAAGVSGALLLLGCQSSNDAAPIGDLRAYSLLPPDAATPEQEPWLPEYPSDPLPDAATPEGPWEPQPAFDAGAPEQPTEPTFDELVEYARECEQATGLTIDEFDCDQGVPIPGQEMNEEGKCRTPNVLNEECDPGSKFQVLQRNAAGSAYAVAHCRKRGLKDGFFDESR